MSSDDAAKTTLHQLRWVPVASGAGRVVCVCGWRSSRVSDDGMMFMPDYVPATELEGEAAVHLAAADLPTITRTVARGE